MSTEWIVAGAEVLCYSTGGTSRRTNSARTRIKKVATKSFTVERDREPRFDLATQTAREGGSWGWTRHCVPIDDPQARSVLATEQRQAKVSDAREAVDLWIRQRTRENRLAAIAALEAVEDES